MAKIPVGATIAHAYRFGFENALNIFKAIYLPLAAQLIVIAIGARPMLRILMASQAHDPAAASLFGPLLLLVPFIMIFFFAEFAAATQTALGQPPRSWLSFHFGKPMWRLMGGFLIGLLAIVAIALGALILMWLIAMALGEVVKLAAGARLPVTILTVLLLVAYFCGLFFLAARFLFLLAPVNISEQRWGVGRAWTLSSGNFWRIFLIALAIMLPISAVNYGYGILLAGWPPFIPGASAEIRSAATALWRIRQLTAMIERWYFTIPLTIILMLFQFGVGCAAQAFAYRSLVPAKNPDTAG